MPKVTTPKAGAKSYVWGTSNKGYVGGFGGARQTGGEGETVEENNSRSEPKGGGIQKEVPTPLRNQRNRKNNGKKENVAKELKKNGNREGPINDSQQTQGEDLQQKTGATVRGQR